MSKLKLVLNRANSKVKLDVGEVERTLQIKADCLIPSDIVVPQSVNKGVPVGARRAQVGRRPEHGAARRALRAPAAGRKPRLARRRPEGADMSLYKRLHEVAGPPTAPDAGATRCSTSCARRSTTT